MRHICGMGDAPKPDDAQAATGSPEPQAQGVDARRRADRVAEEAGRRAREAARARGAATGETGGPEGLEPTRYGDWEKAGRCIDF